MPNPANLDSFMSSLGGGGGAGIDRLTRLLGLWGNQSQGIPGLSSAAPPTDPMQMMSMKGIDPSTLIRLLQLSSMIGGQKGNLAGGGDILTQLISALLSKQPAAR